jgi:hypothetical protein
MERKYKMKPIFFELWNAGLFNQVLSLELAVGLAHETKRPLVVHFFSHNLEKNIYISTPSTRCNDQRNNFTDRSFSNNPHLLDLIDIDTDLIVVNERINSFKQEELVINNLMTGYYYSNKTEITEDELAFADGRERLPLDKAIHLKQTLGWYSRFFYDRSPELNKSISSVKFKQVYADLAKKISDSLGKFQGIHLRLSEHEVNPDFHKEELINDWLIKYESNGLPIVLSTDEPNHQVVNKNKHRFILLDEYIVNNFEKEFKSLPFQDEVVFGLICNLVLHDSVNFVGKSGTTYTSYIQRNRNQKEIETWDFFDNPPKAIAEPYSWNNYPLDNDLKMWWREWPESKC